jgi:UDP-N-acetylglucosamine pyrophosphorylase
MLAAIRTTIQGKKSVRVADLFKVKKYFSTNDIGNQIFRWKMQVYKKNSGLHYLTSELMWRRDDIGESLGQIQHASSKFKKKLDSLKKNKQFLSFIVWSDSFDTYLEARRIANASNFAAGWFAYDSSEEFRYSLADRDDGGGTQKAID